jgi:hypothetical protein
MNPGEVATIIMQFTLPKLNMLYGPAGRLRNDLGVDELR